MPAETYILIPQPDLQQDVSPRYFDKEDVPRIEEIDSARDVSFEQSLIPTHRAFSMSGQSGSRLAWAILSVVPGWG